MITERKPAVRKPAAKRATKSPRTEPPVLAEPSSSAVPAPTPVDGEKIFALDIGTRSVIGIVARQEPDGSLTVLETTRREHTTRAMLDGQIHDVPQVAAVIKAVKEELEKQQGALTSAAVAAAGRALYTQTAEAEMDFNGGLISAEQERRLDFIGIQAAQTQLAASDTVDDPTHYYCVGYSTIRYELDGIPIKSLVGQRGHIAKALIIATFLPRQVIDSMDSALQSVGLAMRAITLEPIAAINVLIPMTMRHLNLVLVDIGAGTSDVAITKNGSVIAYGMVPQAGDEITEAISQRFLLDFNVAERIKREATNGKDVSFEDILGIHYDLRANEVIDPIIPNIQKLGEAIATQIKELNGSEPQAVLLVGGGALTPKLATVIAEQLKMPDGRVAVRYPETVVGINEIPDELHLPDAVTPLGILKIASLNSMHFLGVTVNGEEYRLFNFRDLSISDALLNAGIQMKKYNGKPGLGIMLTVDGESKFFPGTMGTLAEVTLNGEAAALDTPIADKADIVIEPGQDGVTPEIYIADVLDVPDACNVVINGRDIRVAPLVLLNGEPPVGTPLLKDGDEIVMKREFTLADTLQSAGFAPNGKKIHFILNDADQWYTIAPTITVNEELCDLARRVKSGDRIEYVLSNDPKLADVVDVAELTPTMKVFFNGSEREIPMKESEVKVNGRPASLNTIIFDGARIRVDKPDMPLTTVNAVMAAVGFVPPPAGSRVSVEILLNGRAAQLPDFVAAGDRVEVKVRPIDSASLAPPTVAAGTSSAPAPKPPAAKPISTDSNGLKDSLLGDYLSKLQHGEAAAEPSTPTKRSPAKGNKPWDRFR